MNPTSLSHNSYVHKFHHIHPVFGEEEADSDQSAHVAATSCIDVTENSRKVYSDYSYGKMADGLFKERMAAFLVEHPETSTKVAEEDADAYHAKPYCMKSFNLSFQSGIDVCDAILRKQIEHYKNKYSIEINFVMINRYFNEVTQIKPLVDTMVPNSYRALLLFGSLKGAGSAPIIVYKRKDGTSEVLIIRRSFVTEPITGKATRDDSLEKNAKCYLSRKLFVNKFYVTCNSHIEENSDSVGNLIVLRNAMLAMRLDKYKSCEGFEQLFQAAGVKMRQFEHGLIGILPDATDLPPEWNYTDEYFDMANGRGKAVAVHTLYGKKSERVKRMHEALKIDFIQIEDIRKLIGGYLVGDNTIEEFRSRYTFSVTLRHDVTFYQDPEKFSFEQRQQMCVYTIFKQFKVAGLPAPSNATDAAGPAAKSRQTALVATTASK